MNFLNRVKGVYKILTVNLIPGGERLKASLLEQELSMASQHCIRVLARALRQGEEIKGSRWEKK